MESDSGTEYARVFSSETIELKTGKDVQFYVHFWPEDREFQVGYIESVKGRKRKIRNSVSSSHFSRMELLRLFDEIEDRYAPAVEVTDQIQSLQEKILTYANLLPQVISLKSTFGYGGDGFCQCHGRGFDLGITAFYGPALSPGGPASLAIELNQGCKLMEAFYGSPEEVGPQVLKILDEALAVGDDDYELREIDLFRRALLEVLPPEVR